MKILIHDLEPDEAQGLEAQVGKTAKIISRTQEILPCTGCFGCWIKTPGVCVLKDEYTDLGALFGAASEITIVSRCVYGGYSSFVKNVLDRSLGFVLPDFKIVKGKMKHKGRYQNELKINTWFYGAINEKEKHTAQALVQANKENIDCEGHFYFVQDPSAIILEGEV